MNSGLKASIVFATHVEGDFVGVVVVHPLDRRHGQDVEENYRQLDNVALHLRRQSIRKSRTVYGSYLSRLE